MLAFTLGGTYQALPVKRDSDGIGKRTTHAGPLAP